MIVAKEKFKSNIVEYLIYMFQVEDMIRACKFDETIISTQIVSRYQVEPAIRKEINEWYKELSASLKNEGKQENGHLDYITAKMAEVNDFHHFLLQNKDHGDYQQHYQKIIGQIQAIMQKRTGEQNEVEILLESIYAIYLLKLQKKEITKDTEESIKEISGLLALLAHKFKQYEAGEIKTD